MQEAPDVEAPKMKVCYSPSVPCSSATRGCCGHCTCNRSNTYSCKPLDAEEFLLFGLPFSRSGHCTFALQATLSSSLERMPLADLKQTAKV